MQEEADAREEARHAEVKAEAQREGRAREDAVDGEAPHLARRELRAARKARRRREVQLLLPEAHRADEPADEARVLAVAPEGQHGLAVHQAEIRAARLHGHLRDEVEELVVPGGCRTLEPRGIARRIAYRLHDIVSLVPVLQQFGNELGRMLHVAVHRDDDIAVRVVEAAGQRELVAVIACEQHRLDACVFTLELREDGAALVARSVVDKDDFPVKVKTCHRLADGFVEMMQIVLLVVDGYDDGQSLFLHGYLDFPSILLCSFCVFIPHRRDWRCGGAARWP